MRIEMAGALVSLIGAILQTTAQVIIHMIVARIVTGLGVGIMTANVPIVRPSLWGYTFALADFWCSVAIRGFSSS